MFLAYCVFWRMYFNLNIIYGITTVYRCDRNHEENVTTLRRLHLYDYQHLKNVMGLNISNSSENLFFLFYYYLEQAYCKLKSILRRPTNLVAPGGGGGDKMTPNYYQ